MSIFQDLLQLNFNNWSDRTGRHTTFTSGAVLSDQTVNSYKSARFNGNSYLQIIDNDQDWILGSTVNTSRLKNTDWYPTNSDNEFTIDLWIYPESSTQRYFPICSSFKKYWWKNSEYNLGWSFQLDSLTGKLQLISYLFGNCDSRVIESYGIVPLDQWSHIVLMSWKQVDGSSILFFINGVPFGGYLKDKPNTQLPSFPLYVDSFPISNVISHESQYGTEGSPDYSPFYIGLAPRSKFTDPSLVSSFFFDNRYGLTFQGYIARFRVSLGTRYSTSSVFNPLNDPSDTTTTSTYTTHTTTTSVSTTTEGEWGEIPLTTNSKDLLALKLRNDLYDLTNRHVVIHTGIPTYSLTNLGCRSLKFDSQSYLMVGSNNHDFSLGSTILPNTYDSELPLALNDNNFSLEFWIYPELSDSQVLGICSSFSSNFFPADNLDYLNYGEINSLKDFKSGWSIQLDTENQKLQILSFSFGQLSTILESNLIVPLNQWSHVALMAVRKNQYSDKYLFINGIPDAMNPYKNPSVGWTNGIHRLSVTSPIHSYACLYIGLSPFTSITENETLVSLDYNTGLKFKGYLSTFRLSSNCLYPTDGSYFDLYRIPGTTTMSTTTVTTTSTSLTTITSPPEGYVRVGGSIYASSHQPENPPTYATDDNSETAWEPISSPESWVAIECDDTTK